MYVAVAWSSNAYHSNKWNRLLVSAIACGHSKIDGFMVKWLAGSERKNKRPEVWGWRKKKPKKNGTFFNLTVNRAGSTNWQMTCRCPAVGRFLSPKARIEWVNIFPEIWVFVVKYLCNFPFLLLLGFAWSLYVSVRMHYNITPRRGWPLGIFFLEESKKKHLLLYRP